MFVLWEDHSGHSEGSEVTLDPGRPARECYNRPKRNSNDLNQGSRREMEKRQQNSRMFWEIDLLEGRTEGE